MARRASRGQARAGRSSAPAPARAPQRRKPARLWLLGTTALLPVAAGPVLAQPAPTTGPTGGQVVAGQAGIARTPGRTTITQGTDRAAIDWQQFNVGSQHTVQFVQPSQGSWTLNRVVGPDPSVIAGRVQANGGVAIVNQSGVVFAQGAQVDVGSLIASAAGITNENFMAGRMAFDQAPRRGARVENHGTITVADRGLAALVGPNVSNSGVIRARLGRVALGAAETFVLDLAGDGLIGIDVTQAVREAPQGGTALVTNSGTIEAPGGSVLLTAHAASDLVEDLVRQTGRISAPTAEGRAGQVVLRAEGGSVRVEGTIDATGGAGARGGAVAIQASEGVTVAAGATVDASGGAGGGRVLVGTEGRGRAQRMARQTTVEAGATIRADATTAGNGGEIVVNSSARTEMRGTLTARGGSQSGNGGFIEVSGQGAFVLHGIVDLTAANGALGDFLLDPQNIIISINDPPTLPYGTVTETILGPTGLDPATLPTGSISAAGTVNATTGGADDWVRIGTGAINGYTGGNIILEANRQIIVDSPVTRTNPGNVTLRAGVGTGVTDGNIVQRADANISVNGTLTLETNRGAIDLGANVRATSVVLSASGDITQSGGNIQHRGGAGTQLPLSAISTGGSVTLAQAGNGNIALGASGATAGDFTVSANTLRVGSSLTANTTSLTAATGTLTLAGDIRATSLALSGATGVTQSAGTIAHRDSTPATPIDLVLTATTTTSGAVTLDQTGNGPVALGASTAAGNFTLTAETIRTTDALTGNVVTLTAETGGIELGANVRATDLNLVAQTGINQTGGTIAHRSGATTPIDLAASLAAAGDINLEQANGEINLLGGGTFAGNFRLAATGDTTLAAGETLSVAGQATISLTGTADLTLNGTLRADSVILQAQGDIAQATTAVLAPVSTAPGAALNLTVTASGANNSVDLVGANGVTRLLAGATEGAAFALQGAGLTIAGPLNTSGTGATRGDVTLISTGTTGAIALGGTVTARNATLRANGAITQTAALDLGGTGGGALTIRGQAGGTSDAGSATLTGANQVATLDARTAGALAFTSAATTLTVNEARGDGVAITGTGVTVASGGGASRVTGTGTGAVSIVADSLTVAGGIAQASGGTISLRTDAITTGGTISAPSGTVEIGPRTAGRGVLVSSTADATRLRITETALNAVTAGTVRLGRTTIGASTVTGGAVEIAGAVSLLDTRTFEVAAGGDITLGAAVEAGRVRLGAAGNIALGTFDVTADGTTGGIELRAGGTITQGTGSELIASGGTRDLVAQAGAGNLSLTGTGSFRVANGGADPRGLVAPGDITVNLGTSGALTLGAAVQAGGTANLTARSIDIQAALTAPIAVNLTASGGGTASTIGQSATGTITTALLTANAGGAVTLAEAPNQVANLGSFSFNDAFGFRTNAAVTVSGAIAPTTPGSNANITLIASSLDLGAAIAAGTGTVTLQATGGDVTQTAAGIITAGRLEASASGSVLLEAAANAVGTFGAGGAGGTFALRTGQSLTIADALSQGGGGGILRLTTDGSLTVANGGSIAFSDITLAAASGMTISGDIGQAGATVRLGAGGAITQTATGGITAGTLGLHAVGDIALTAGTNTVGAMAALTDGTFAYRGNGTVQTTTVAGVVRPFFNPFLPGGFLFVPDTASGIRAASVDITADGLRVQRSTTTGVPLEAGVAATGTTGQVTLRVDRLAIDADSAITAGDAFAGNIDIATRTAGRNIVIGADPGGGTLSLDAGVLGRLYGQTVTVGAAGAGAGTLTVAGPASSNAVGELALRGTSIAINDVLSMFGDGRVSLTAATGDITQSGMGSISAPNLVATATLGDVRLDVLGAANGITGTVSGSAGGGDFAFRNTGNVSVAAPGITATGGTVTLVSTAGGVSQAAGAPITTGTLVASAAGAVTLNLGTNAVDTLGANSSGGAGFTFRNGGALTVAGVSSTSGGITLEAPGGMTLTGNVSAPTGRVLLRTGAGFDTPGAGGISQTGGVITASGLAASAGGTIALTGANQVATLVAGADAANVTSARSVVAGTGFTLSNARADIPFFGGTLPGLIVTAPVSVGSGGTIALLTNGLGISFGGTAFLAPGGTVRFAPFTDGRAIDIGGASAGATNLAIGTLQQVSAGRLVVGGTTGQGGQSGDIVFSGAVALPGVNTLELQSGGAISGNAFALSVNRVSAFANGDISLGGVGGTIGGVAAGTSRVEGIATDGSVSIVSAGTLAVDAAIEAGAGRTIALQAADFAIGADVRTGAGTPGRIEITGTQTTSLGGAAGAARLDTAELDRLHAAGGTIRVTAPAIRLDGAWTLDPADAARLELFLAAGGAGTIVQNVGGLSAGTLVIDARQGAGTVALGAAGNAIGTLDALTTGTLTVTTGGNLTVQRANATGGNIAITGGSVTLADTPGIAVRAAAGTVALTATAGDVTGTTLNAAVVGTGLTATALDGRVNLAGNNTVGTFTGTARDGVLFRNTGALTAAATGGPGTAVAGDIDIRATALALGDIRATGTVTLDASTGDIVQTTNATLAAGTLAATAAGSIRLDGGSGLDGAGDANNRIQDLTALSAGGDIVLRNGTALTIDLPLSVGTNRSLILEAAGLTIAGNLSAAGPFGEIVLRTGGFTGGANAGDITQQAGTTITAARLAALAGGTITLDQPGNAIGTLAGGRDATGAANGLALSAGGDATVRIGAGATLGVAEAVQVGTGRTLTLRADDLDIAAQLRAPGGTIALLPVTAGTGYVLGGASGSATAGRMTLDTAELGFLPATTPAAVLALGDVATTGAITIAGTVDLVDGAAPRVGLLALAGNAGLTQDAGTLLDVAALSATFPNGSVLLDPGNGGNRIAALAGVTAGGDVVVRGGAGTMELRDGGTGDAVVAGPGGRIVLRADDLAILGDVRTAGGTIHILPETTGRAVTLGAAGAGTLAIDAAEAVRLGAGGAAAARLVIGTDGVVRSAGDIRIAGNVALRGGGTERVAQLDLVAGGAGIAGGSVSQSGGTVDVATLTGTAQGDFSANGATNRIDAFGGITSGRLAAGGTAAADIALRSAIDARVAGLDATRDLTVTGGGTLTAAPVTVATDAGSTTFAADLLAGGRLSLTAAGALSAGPVTATDIALQGATIALTGRAGGNGANAASVTLTAPGGGTITQDPGAVIAANRLAVTGGTVTLTEANQVAEITGFAAGGAVGFTSVLPLLVSGAVTANGTLALTTSGTLTVAAGASLGVTGAPGTASLSSGGAMTYAGRLTTTGDATLVASTGGVSFTGNGSVGGAARITAPGAVTLGGSLVAAGAVEATAGAGLSSTGTLRAGSTMRLQAGGGATLAGTLGAGGEVRVTAGTGLGASGTITSGAGLFLRAGGALTQSGTARAGLGLTFQAGGAMTLGGTMTAGTDVSLTAGGLATLANGKIGAPGTIALLSGGGLVMQSFSIDPAVIRLETAGALTASDTVLVSSDSIRLAGGSVTLRDMAISTGTLDVESGSTMLLDGGTYTLGRAVLFSAPGGISAGDVIAIRPRDGSQLPVVMFDTRAAGATPDPLSVVRPDIPGLPNAQQPMQVRLPGTEVPGVFGPASSAAAGPIAVNIDAGRSPIFLLIDGGFASGTIVSAGRLGIHGTGGGAELTGTLTDITGSPVSGSAAARFADSTRPAASGALSRYRLNGCVISSVNCIVPSQVISIPQAPPQRVDITLGGGRITDPDVQIPNVAEEDY